MARPKDRFPSYSWPNILRQAHRRPKSNGGDESQGEGDEGREGGRKTGTLIISVHCSECKANFEVTVAANTSYQGQESCERGERAV